MALCQDIPLAFNTDESL